MTIYVSYEKQIHVQGDPKKRAPILIILNTRGTFFLDHPVFNPSYTADTVQRVPVDIKT